VVAFLLFLSPKPSDEAEQRQQMVPRALIFLAGYADGPRGCGRTTSWHASLVRDEIGCDKVDRREMPDSHSHCEIRPLLSFGGIGVRGSIYGLCDTKPVQQAKSPAPVADGGPVSEGSSQGPCSPSEEDAD